MLIHEAAALGAALCFTFAGLFSIGPVRQLGAVAFTRIRLLIVFVLLGTSATLTDGWITLDHRFLFALLLSGAVGIFLGDTALFATLRRLGPRLTAIVFSTSAPMTAFLGLVVLGERLSAGQWLGAALVMGGVVLAITYGKRREQNHHWEKLHGPLAAGVAFGLFAALCQSVGIIIARPVMASGIDPVAASALRVGVAGLLLMTPVLLRLQPLAPMRVQPVALARIAVSGLLGMAVGMTLLLFALREGEAGIVATLSATPPILILPVLWVMTGERPAVGAWIGAALAVVGTGLIVAM